jgi:hypothetical protein
MRVSSKAAPISIIWNISCRNARQRRKRTSPEEVNHRSNKQQQQQYSTAKAGSMAWVEIVIEVAREEAEALSDA